MARCRLSLSVMLSICVVGLADAEERPVVPLAPPSPLPAAVEVTARPHNTDRGRELSPLEHLRKAIEHLEAAGFNDAAAQLKQKADEQQAAASNRLKLLRTQRDDLQREIRQLEKLTGEHQQIALECRIVEGDLQRLIDLDITWQGADDREAHTLDARFIEQPQLMSAGAAKALLDELRSRELIKEFAHPSIVTTFGRPATLMSGGEFPIVLPGDAESGDVRVQWREFGTRMEAVCHVLGAGRVRIDVAPEVSERDFNQAITLAGYTIPGLNTRRLNTQLDMEIGQTMVFALQSMRAPASPILTKIPHIDLLFAPLQTGGDTLTLFLVTPSLLDESD